MRIAVFDCPLGIAGDMTVGALIDAGVPFDYLQKQIAKLGLEGYTLSVKETRSGAFRAKKFSVHLPGKPLYLLSGHEHAHTPLSEIERRIRKSRLSAGVQKRAIAIFRKLGRAESQVHGIALEKVHFHEVGGVDSIIDIVGTAVCLDYLKIGRGYVRSIAVGKGVHTGHHGLMPIPVPGAYELLKGRVLTQTAHEHEMVTPTGAAILAAVCAETRIPKFKLEKIGYGAGDKTFDGHPGLLRVGIGESA